MSLPRLHAVATDAVARQLAFLEHCTEMQDRCGADLAIHLRLRDTPIRRMLELAELLEQGAAETEGWLVINGRVDVALASGADAVQLGADALPIAAVRSIVGDALTIGASVHDLRTADSRRREGADYLVVGTVFSTPTHLGVVPGGHALISAVSDAGLPIIAIGGIDRQTAAGVRAAGAHGVAVIRAIWDAAEPAAAAEEICATLTR
ncbi:MAG: thiamine phosphate synthase [Gemmatimonadota bacterium]|nr:thiamine phosphate synthase [Gemmatimonadota bacterium]MDH3426946.1 thiamine phosphate synthase [Gemmatimonadota bacterium]